MNIRFVLIGNACRLLLLTVACSLGLTLVHAQAAELHELVLPGEPARVQLDAGHADEQFDSFIVYYRNDAEPGDDEAKAAKETLDLVAKDLLRVNKKLKLKARHERRIATGGHLLRLPKALAKSAAQELMLELASNPEIEFVEPNAMRQALATPNDPRYSQQWGLRETAGGINIEPAWDHSVGDGVVIAVIDTGRTAHPDLDAKTLPGYDFVSNATSAGDGNGRDNDPADTGDWSAPGTCGEGSEGRTSSTWHGTHVAGIAAALTHNQEGVAGAAPGAWLQHVRVLGKCGGSTVDISEAIIWASGGRVSGVPDNPTPARVLNLSLGGSGACSTTEQRAIDSARSRKSVVVIAAGNDNSPSVYFSPGNCTGIVTVAANDRAGKRTSYSNYGPGIDVAAPGGDLTSEADQILSTLNTGTRGPSGPTYGYKPGTSMATPYVAGVAALILERKPSLTSDQVAAILRNSARPFPTNCTGGCGTGIVDAAAAVRIARGGAYTAFPVSVALYGDGSGKVTSTPSGIDCGSNCSGRFNKDRNVTLKATPAAGYEFDYWAGACSGTATTCTLSSLKEAKLAYAVFSIPVKPLSNGSQRNNLKPTNGVPLIYAIDIPAGATNFKVQMSGGSGEADLYVRRGAKPSKDAYDCRPFIWGNNENCTFDAPMAGTWYVMLNPDPNFSGVSLKTTYSSAPLGGKALGRNKAVAGIAIPEGGARYFRFNLPDNAVDLEIRTQGGSGDMDLYVAQGRIPSLEDYDCRPYKSGNNETCATAMPPSGTWYIMLHGAKTSNGISLRANYANGKRLVIGWDGAGAGSVKVKRFTTGEVVANCEALPCQLPLYASVTYDLIGTAANGSRLHSWAAGKCDKITPEGGCRVKMTVSRNPIARFTLQNGQSPVLTVNRFGSGDGWVAATRVANNTFVGACTAYPCRMGLPATGVYDFTGLPGANANFGGWVVNQCDSIRPNGDCRIRVERPTTMTVKFPRK